MMVMVVMMMTMTMTLMTTTTTTTTIMIMTLPPHLRSRFNDSVTASLAAASTKTGG